MGIKRRSAGGAEHDRLGSTVEPPPPPPIIIDVPVVSTLGRGKKLTNYNGK